MTRVAIKPSPAPLPAPTPEQEHILHLLTSTKSNLLINALAGSGKTSTLEMIQDVAAPPVLCLAFNRRIADETVDGQHRAEERKDQAEGQAQVEVHGQAK